MGGSLQLKVSVSVAEFCFYIFSAFKFPWTTWSLSSPFLDMLPQIMSATEVSWSRWGTNGSKLFLSAENVFDSSTYKNRNPHFLTPFFIHSYLVHNIDVLAPIYMVLSLILIEKWLFCLWSNFQAIVKQLPANSTCRNTKLID